MKHRSTITLLVAIVAALGLLAASSGIVPGEGTGYTCPGITLLGIRLLASPGSR